MNRWTLALVVFGVVPFAAAQSTGPLPPLTAQVEVHVVNVDVSVTDSNGPVGNLTKDDFEILEDGKLQKITNFAIINSTTEQKQPAAVAQNATADNRRRMLLIIDNNYLSIRDRNRALDTIEKYLDSSFNGEWAVATVGHAVDMLQPFTTDKALIHTALAKARKMGSAEEQSKIDRSVLSERYTTSSDVNLPVDYQGKLDFSGQEQSFRNLLTVQNTARAVVDTARAYSAESGKKFILLLTGGMEINTTFSAFNQVEESKELQQIQLQTAEIVDAMVKEANGANFTVHVVNARNKEMVAPQHDVTNRSSGINSGNLLNDWNPSPIDTSDRDSIPLSIALGTGGMYLPSNDLAGSIQKIDSVTSNFYSLGYSPAHSGDRKYHTIRVKVHRRGVRVANRVGYYDQTPDDRLEDMLRARMDFDPGYGTLPVRVQLGNPSPAEKDLILPVTAEMPLARITVIPRDQNLVGRVHVYCSVFDVNGRNVGFSHQTQEVSMPQEVATSGGDFRYTVRVHLKKGEAFTVVITLRDELSNEIGSKTQAVHL